MAVLEKNGCEVVVPAQRCCGMPFLESGDIDSARECRWDNVTAFLPFVRAGYTIVAPGPTCSLTLKKEYPVVGPEPEAEGGRRRDDGSLRVPDAPPRVGEALDGLPALARQGPLSGPLPPQGPGHRLSLAGPAAAHTGQRGRHRRALHGARRHVEHEDGVLPDLDEGRPARLRRRAPREAGSGRVRLPARGHPDPPGHRQDRQASDPDRRRGVRAEGRGRVESRRVGAVESSRFPMGVVP